MSQKSGSAITVIGIDTGNNSFHVVGQDRRGAIGKHVGLSISNVVKP
jgi:hypothetical protein